jgi:dGTPase
MSLIRTREAFEREEAARLAPFAARSSESRGRVIAEPQHPYRTDFQRDRDRLVHSRAFRRLEYKTQVFVYHEGDHYRNRLTHTLEGGQISRTIARALRLNEELAEAVVLAHDLGHTPFGHAGERALAELMREEGGFDHNRQGLRIVDLLEERYPGFRGLNLTYETREGICKHGSPWEHPVTLPDPALQPSLEKRRWPTPPTRSPTPTTTSTTGCARDCCGSSSWTRSRSGKRRAASSKCGWAKPSSA